MTGGVILFDTCDVASDEPVGAADRLGTPRSTIVASAIFLVVLVILRVVLDRIGAGRSWSDHTMAAVTSCALTTAFAAWMLVYFVLLKGQRAANAARQRSYRRSWIDEREEWWDLTADIASRGDVLRLGARACRYLAGIAAFISIFGMAAAISDGTLVDAEWSALFPSTVAVVALRHARSGAMFIGVRGGFR